MCFMAIHNRLNGPKLWLWKSNLLTGLEHAILATTSLHTQNVPSEATEWMPDGFFFPVVDVNEAPMATLASLTQWRANQKLNSWPQAAVHTPRLLPACKTGLIAQSLSHLIWRMPTGPIIFVPATHGLRSVRGTQYKTALCLFFFFLR